MFRRKRDLVGVDIPRDEVRLCEEIRTHWLWIAATSGGLLIAGATFLDLAWHVKTFCRASFLNWARAHCCLRFSSCWNGA